MASVEEILAQLDKNTLKMVRRGSEINDRRIPFASFGLNQVTGGGLSLGKQHTIFGNESAGKSAVMLQTIALNQANGLSCLYIDTEKTFDQDWAARLGVDVDKIIVSQVSTMQAATAEQIKFIEAGIDLIVIDSRSFLQPQNWYNDKELKGLEGTKQIGQFSKDLGVMCNLVQSVNWNTAIVHLSQVRMDLSGMHATHKQDGGKAAEHADSLRIRLTSSKSDAQAIKDQISYGDVLIEEKIGRLVTWEIVKNKLNGNLEKGEYNLHTKGDFVGIDRASEIVSYATKFGLIRKAGAWMYFEDEQFQGASKLIKRVREDEALLNRLEKSIIEVYNG